MAVLDPPYGLGKAKWDKEGWKTEDFKQVLDAVARSSTNKNMCFISFCAAEQYHHLVEAAKSCQWTKPRFNVVYKKNKNSEGSRRITQTCEYFAQTWRNTEHAGIWNFKENTRERIDFYKTSQIGRGGYISTEVGTTCVNPCQKPQQLLQRIVRNFTTPGATVLDLCAGSHSLLFACLKLGRSCVSIEKDIKQHLAAIQRIRTVFQKNKRANKKRIREEKKMENITDFPEPEDAEGENPKKKRKSKSVSEKGKSTEELSEKKSKPDSDLELTQNYEADTQSMDVSSIGISTPGSTLDALEFLQEGGYQDTGSEL